MSTAQILIVEDSPTHMRLITDLLSRNGHHILTAVDGEEALEIAIEQKPRLILLDIILPKKNGFQVCRQLKTSPHTQGIKIIMLTSKTQDSDRFWGLKQGADEYMTKPFENEALMACVAKLLGDAPHDDL